MATAMTKLNTNTLQRNNGEKMLSNEKIDVPILIYPQTVENESLNRIDEWDY